MALYAKIDCAIVRDPKMVAAGPLGAWLYVRATLYCRENLTDGFIDERVLDLIASDVVKPKRHIQRLLDVGLLLSADGGWRIPEHVWRKWNPTKAEVEDLRKQEADRKKSYRDKKGRNERVPTGHDRVSAGRPGRRPGQPEPEPEPEPEPSLSQPTAGTSRGARVDAALAALAERDLDQYQTRGGQVRDARAFAERCLSARRRDHIDELTKLAKANPKWTNEQLADAISPQAKPPATSCDECGWTTDHEQPHAFVHAEWIADPADNQRPSKAAS